MKPDLDTREAYLFDLPEAQIAMAPEAERAQSRLLVLGGVDESAQSHGDQRHHLRFESLPDLLQAGDLLVVNDVRVRPCRIFAQKETGGQVEVLILEVKEAPEGGWSISAMIRANRRLKPGQILSIPHTSATLTYQAREDGGLARLHLKGEEIGDLEDFIERIGEMPLPPYIVKRRKELGQARHTEEDRTRYQTVYANKGTAVAAPTAGLHFTPELLEQLKAKGVERATLCLDVGPGTFKPVKADSLDDHDMHTESYFIPSALIEAFKATRARGGRVIAVGTTAVRALEAQFQQYGELREGAHETALFLRPGCEFKAIDGMVTNFHLPGSTLIVLVAAFAGYERVMSAYREAVERGYRFYSYGDAMLVWPNSP